MADSVCPKSKNGKHKWRPSENNEGEIDGRICMKCTKLETGRRR